MTPNILRRRDGLHYRFSLSLLDSCTITLLEVAAHEPTRRLSVCGIEHADELQDLCDKWNKTNRREAERLRAGIGPEYER